MSACVFAYCLLNFFCKFSSPTKHQQQYTCVKSLFLFWLLLSPIALYYSKESVRMRSKMAVPTIATRAIWAELVCLHSPGIDFCFYHLDWF
uniref:Uncharacterized protein n=1 Tax=Anopheles aquasalis TaxID=42839 RepID=T1E8H4_ANOAQ